MKDDETMKRSVVETLLGAVVILVAVTFLAYGYKKGDVASPGGYEITADFSGIGGLKPGDTVQISGVKVGTVTAVNLVPDNFLARVHMSVDSSLQLPSDTAALISSESLLGGRYLLLEPGAEDDTIPPGGRIAYTQAPQNLEQLLGQFIFSMKDGKDAQDQSAAPAAQVALQPSEPPAPQDIPQP
jgi:phospholipid/cholesterol/gamma-HCH transport system substrate-binding protein